MQRQIPLTWNIGDLKHMVSESTSTKEFPILPKPPVASWWAFSIIAFAPLNCSCQNSIGTSVSPGNESRTTRFCLSKFSSPQAGYIGVSVCGIFKKTSIYAYLPASIRAHGAPFRDHHSNEPNDYSVLAILWLAPQSGLPLQNMWVHSTVRPPCAFVYYLLWISHPKTVFRFMQVVNCLVNQRVSGVCMRLLSLNASRPLSPTCHPYILTCTNRSGQRARFDFAPSGFRWFSLCVRTCICGCSCTMSELATNKS